MGKNLKNVLSLFDGISCGQVALKRAGITFGNYYASEINKYPIHITQKNKKYGKAHYFMDLGSEVV